MEKIHDAESLYAVALHLLYKNSSRESYNQAIKDAADEFGKVWDMNKKSAIGQAAILTKGKLLMDIVEFSEAIAAYDQLISFSNKDIFVLQAYVDKGDVLMSLIKYKEAGQCYDKAFDIACFNLKYKKNISEQRICDIIDEIVDRKHRCHDRFDFLFFSNPLKNMLKKEKNEVTSTALKAKL